MKAGIDIGSTLIKIAFQKGKQVKLVSSADYSISQLAKILKKNKITQANIAGIGNLPKEFKFLKINRNKDLIKNEIKIQVKGLKKLNNKLPKNYILVSIGTGISYTVVKGKSVRKISIGSSIGGGTILGLSKVLGFRDFDQLVELANQGNAKKTDEWYGDLIVGNLANISQKTAKKDLAAGLMNLIAITVYKDLMLYKLDKQKIIIIGSTLKNNKCLKRLLKKYIKNTYFITNSEYATCLGALELGDN